MNKTLWEATKEEARNAAAGDDALRDLLFIAVLILNDIRADVEMLNNKVRE